MIERELQRKATVGKVKSVVREGEAFKESDGESWTDEITDFSIDSSAVRPDSGDLLHDGVRYLPVDIKARTYRVEKRGEIRADYQRAKIPPDRGVRSTFVMMARKDALYKRCDSERASNEVETSAETKVLKRPMEMSVVNRGRLAMYTYSVRTRTAVTRPDKRDREVQRKTVRHSVFRIHREDVRTDRVLSRRSRGKLTCRREVATRETVLICESDIPGACGR